MLENTTLDIKNRSHTITAEIEAPQGSAQGVIIAQGGRFGGWSLYIKDGRLKYCYNWLDRQRYTLESKEPLPAGKVTVKFQFDYDGGGVGKGASGQLFVNGQKVAVGRIERTQPFIFSADETEDVGEDLGTPVTEDYKEGDNKFTGTIDKVTIAITPPPAQIQEEEESQDAVIDEGIN
jgi:hypothetical protein